MRSIHVVYLGLRTKAGITDNKVLTFFTLLPIQLQSFRETNSPQDLFQAKHIIKLDSLALSCFHMQASSLRTADAFPVVASLPRRERSDDRKCVCCSQASKRAGAYLKFSFVTWIQGSWEKVGRRLVKPLISFHNSDTRYMLINEHLPTGQILAICRCRQGSGI